MRRATGPGTGAEADRRAGSRGGDATEEPHGVRWGGHLEAALQQMLPDLPSLLAFPDLGRSWEEARLGSSHPFTAGHAEALSGGAPCWKHAALASGMPQGSRPPPQPPTGLLLTPESMAGLMTLLARFRCQQAAGGSTDSGVVHTGQQEECSHPEAGPAAAAVSASPSVPAPPPRGGGCLQSRES